MLTIHTHRIKIKNDKWITQHLYVDQWDISIDSENHGTGNFITNSNTI